MTSASLASLCSAKWAVCSACSSWVTGSPLYCSAPWRANSSSMSARLSTTASAQRALSSAVPSAANCDWRIRVAVSAPADSRIG